MNLGFKQFLSSVLPIAALTIGLCAPNLKVVECEEDPYRLVSTKDAITYLEKQAEKEEDINTLKLNYKIRIEQEEEGKREVAILDGYVVNDEDHNKADFYMDGVAVSGLNFMYSRYYFRNTGNRGQATNTVYTISTTKDSPFDDWYYDKYQVDEYDSKEEAYHEASSGFGYAALLLIVVGGVGVTPSVFLDKYYIATENRYYTSTDEVDEDDKVSINNLTFETNDNLTNNIRFSCEMLEIERNRNHILSVEYDGYMPVHYYHSLDGESYEYTYDWSGNIEYAPIPQKYPITKYL